MIKSGDKVRLSTGVHSQHRGKIGLAEHCDVYTIGDGENRWEWAVRFPGTPIEQLYHFDEEDLEKVD